MSVSAEVQEDAGEGCSLCASELGMEDAQGRKFVVII